MTAWFDNSTEPSACATHRRCAISRHHRSAACRRANDVQRQGGGAFGVSAARRRPTTETVISKQQPAADAPPACDHDDGRPGRGAGRQAAGALRAAGVRRRRRHGRRVPGDRHAAGPRRWRSRCCRATRPTKRRSAASATRPKAPPGSTIRTSPASTTSARTAAGTSSSSSSSRARTSASSSSSAGRCGLEDALHYTLQVAEALAHSSSRDVVHRDIKPSNVLVTAGDAGEAGRYGPGPAAPGRVVVRRSDGQRRDARHVRLHLARAGPRPALGRRAERHLLARLHALLHAHRPAAVSRWHARCKSCSGTTPTSRPTCGCSGPSCRRGWRRCWRKMLAKRPSQRQQTAGELSAEILALGQQLGLAKITQHGQVVVAAASRRGAVAGTGLASRRRGRRPRRSRHSGGCLLGPARRRRTSRCLRRDWSPARLPAGNRRKCRCKQRSKFTWRDYDRAAASYQRLPELTGPPNETVVAAPSAAANAAAAGNTLLDSVDGGPRRRPLRCRPSKAESAASRSKPKCSISPDALDRSLTPPPAVPRENQPAVCRSALAALAGAARAST